MPDSQDFYSGDHTELLNTPPKVGNIVDTAGNVLGTHDPAITREKNQAS